MKMNLTGAIEILKLHKHTTDKFKHSIGDQYVSDAIDTVVKALEKPTYTAEDMESFAAWVSLGYSIEPEKSNGERGIVYYENGTFNYATRETKLYTITDLLKIWKEEQK